MQSLAFARTIPTRAHQTQLAMMTTILATQQIFRLRQEAALNTNTRSEVRHGCIAARRILWKHRCRSGHSDDKDHTPGEIEPPKTMLTHASKENSQRTRMPRTPNQQNLQASRVCIQDQYLGLVFRNPPLLAWLPKKILSSSRSCFM